MKHPKTHLVTMIKARARQLREYVALSERQEQERYDEAVEDHRQSVPEVRELIGQADKILADPDATGEDYEHAKALLLRVDRRFAGRIPTPFKPDSPNQYRVDADALDTAAELLDAAEGDTVTTSDLGKMGILQHIRV